MEVPKTICRCCRSRLAGLPGRLLLLLLAFSAAAHAQFSYTIANDQVTITKYSGYDTEVAIPEKINDLPVTRVDKHAFSGCTRVIRILIPSSVTGIDYSAFFNCTSLANFVVDALNPAYCSQDGVLFDKLKTTIVRVPDGKTGTYAIPYGVTSVQGMAFSGCANLTGITIPNTITVINSHAFLQIPKLTSIVIPNSVTAIESSAFTSCTGLESVTMGSNVAAIDSTAFIGCTSLKRAVFLGNAPTTASFASAPSDFTVYYFNDKTGFTSPTWNGYQSVNMGNSSPLPPWLLSKGLSHDANPQSTPNGDGVSLLMAYALNLDPTRNQSGSLPRPVIADNQISLTYYTGSEGITYTVESSADLQQWDTADVTVSSPDADQFRTATVSASGPRRFLRLVVTK